MLLVAPDGSVLEANHRFEQFFALVATEIKKPLSAPFSLPSHGSLPIRRLLPNSFVTPAPMIADASKKP